MHSTTLIQPPGETVRVLIKPISMAVVFNLLFFQLTIALFIKHGPSSSSHLGVIVSF